MQKKLSVIIPAYNEARYLDEILGRVASAPACGLEKEIIIVESNSTDGTRELVKKYEKKAGYRVIYEQKPQGKGHAVRNGLRFATGGIILIQDADLEYDPGEYPKLLKPILDGRADFVLGSRHLGSNSMFIRKFERSPVRALYMNLGAKFLDTVFNVLYGAHLTDPQTMYKVFKKECLNGITLRSNYFDLDWEIVGKFVREGHIPLEIPVSYKSRSTGEGKKIRLSRDALKNLSAIIKYRFGN